MTNVLSTLVERAADRLGDHAALSRLDVTLSYAALEARSARVARSLASLGLRPGDRVGLLQHQTLETLTALHGILRAGAVYVAIDPQQPPARIASILDRCHARVLFSDGLTPKLLETVLALSRGVRIVIGAGTRLDGTASIAWESVLAGLSDTRLPKVREADPAYVIFTSGSTSEPKGIVHTHRSAWIYAATAARQYALSERDRIAAIAPLHFDQSTFHLFAAPLAGSSIFVVPEAHARFPATLAKRLADDRVTVIYTVPFLLVQLLLRGGLDGTNLDAVRWVLFGGEPFPVGHLRALMRRLPEACFSNVYGPAEVNQCTQFKVPRDVELDAVPVGTAWSAAEVRVMNEQEEPADLNEPGELWVSTETMMERYWGGAVDDSEVFAWRRDGAGELVRYYRTGDRFRQDANGCLWFLGRMDRQVKVRGQRLNLDEVESVLYQHDGVVEAAAFLVERRDAMPTVEAAVIPKPETSVSANELKRFAMARLPTVAVPQHFEIRTWFPRTGSDKIDRRALAQARVAAERDE